MPGAFPSPRPTSARGPQPIAVGWCLSSEMLCMSTEPRITGLFHLDRLSWRPRRLYLAAGAAVEMMCARPARPPPDRLRFPCRRIRILHERTLLAPRVNLDNDPHVR
jgi:hypothetical protein